MKLFCRFVILIEERGCVFNVIVKCVGMVVEAGLGG